MKSKASALTPLDYENILDAIGCSLLLINEKKEVLFLNAAAEKRRQDLSLDYPALLERLSRQFDILQGHGSTVLDYAGHSFICSVFPWNNEAQRAGSIMLLRERKSFASDADEIGILNYVANEIETIIESVDDGVIVADKDGTIICINKEIERVFAVKRGNLVGRVASEIENDGIFKEKIIDRVIATQDKVMVSSDYNDKKLIYTGIPGFNKAGQLTAVFVTVQDVSAVNGMRHQLVHQEMMIADYLHMINKMKSSNVDIRGVVINSKKMKQIMEITEIVAQVDSTVLVTGESGTGKEIIVDEIYHKSLRKNKPLIKVNCGAIPDTLFEVEMFGYENGSFTGARKNGKIGFFELANSGTLFLDEIGELSLAAQVKLLRVIQDKKVQRIGSTKTVQVDVRIIAATNRDLWQMVLDKKFRQDLYYRLHVINIDVPPLRERRDDIIPLAYYFVQHFNKKYNKSKRLSVELCQLFLEMDWEGNIREMENVMEAMVILTQEDILLPEHMPSNGSDGRSQPTVVLRGILPWKEALKETERQLIIHAKAKYGTTRKMAEALQIDQSTISRKMKQMKMTENDA